MFFHNYKINKTHNVNNTYYDFTNGVVINKQNTINTNDTHNVSKIIKLVNVNDNSYFAKKIEHQSSITNNITGHNRNNCEHNVIKTVHKHMKHVNIYDTDINYYSKKSLIIIIITIAPMIILISEILRT